MLVVIASKSQTTFWTETFSTSPVCNSVPANGANPTGNGTWSVASTGTNDMFANVWYISAREAGMGVGICGNDCSTTPTLINQSMHISTNAALFGDNGASYSAGPGLSNTDLRAQSPTINCSGKNGIKLKFNYIMWGVVNQDYVQVQYSPDNGATWTNLGIPPQTPTNTCAGQGIWTSYSVALPASANNNATVKIGFRWQNVSTNGADPSTAIDDVALTYSTTSTVSLTPTFSLQTSICRGDSTYIVANTGTTTATGYTWSASPGGAIFTAPTASATYVKFNNSTTYTVTLTAAAGTVIASVNHTIFVNPSPTIGVSSSTMNVCIGNSATLTASGGVNYTWTPGNFTVNPVVVTPTVNTSYVCVGSSSLGCKSNTFISITTSSCSGGSTGLNEIAKIENTFNVFPNPVNDKLSLQVGNENLSNVKVEMTDVLGKKLMALEYTTMPAGSVHTINTSALPKGVFFVNLKANGKVLKTIKVIKE